MKEDDKQPEQTPEGEEGQVYEKCTEVKERKRRRKKRNEKKKTIK